MNKRKLLAWLAALTLLVTGVATAVVLPASAAVTVQSISAADVTAKHGDNLLKGLTPVLVGDTYCADTATLSRLTDGTVDVSDANARVTLKPAEGANAHSTGYVYFYFDLGEEKTVGQALLASGISGWKYPAYRYLHNGKVYVGNNTDTLFTDSNLAMSYSKGFGNADANTLVGTDTPITGRYVGFAVYHPSAGESSWDDYWDGKVVFSEVGAYAAVEQPPQGPPSLLSGLTATVGAGQNVSGDLKNLTDGNADTTASSDTGSDNDGTAQFSYELDKRYDIDKVVITSTNEGASFYLYSGSVYISDSADTLWAESSQVKTFSYPQGQAERTLTFEFDQPVTGKYIGFKFGVDGDGWWWRARVGELEAYGEETTTPPPPSGPVSLLSGLTATLGAGQSIRGGTVANLTDGNPDTVFSSDTGADNDQNTQMQFKLDKVYAINKVVISSSNEGADFNLYDGNVYVSAYENRLWKETNLVKAFTYTQGQAERTLTFEFDQPVIGQYIGFAFNVNGNGWWYCARVGELEAYGEEYTGEITEDDGSAKIEGGTVTPVTDMPAGSLLLDKSSSIPNGWNGAAQYTAQNVERLNDGVVHDGTDDTQTRFVDAGKAITVQTYFTMGQSVTIDKLFIDSPVKKINEDFAVYVSNHPSTLFTERSCVFLYRGEEDTTPARMVVELTAPVTGRYVGFRFNATQADYGLAIGELAVYGTVDTAGAMTTNLVAGQKPVDIYISEVGMPDKYNEGSATYGYLNETDVNDANMVKFTDGDHETRGSYTHMAMDGRECSSTLENRKKICADTPWSVLVYHLGGTATVDEIYLTSTGEGGWHWIGGADFYVGTTLATLFDPANRVYTSGGEKTTVDEYGNTILDPEADLPDRYSSVVLDQPREARYVALVITRPTTTKSEGWSIARINEFEVFGNLLHEDEKVNTLFTESTYGCSLNLSQLNYDDVDFIKNIDRLEVTRSAYTAENTFVDKWLMVDPEAAYIYSFVLHTKDGKVLSAADVGERSVDVTIPNVTGHMQSLAKVQDGTVERIVNARTEGEQLIGEGITGSWQLVPIVFDDSPVIWSGIAAGNGADGDTAGATEETTSSAAWLWTLPVLAAAVLAVLLKRRRAQ